MVAVSYTHLDVYKRQLRNRVRSFGVLSRHLGLEILDDQETGYELTDVSSRERGEWNDCLLYLK